MCMLIFIHTYGILLLIRFFAMITLIITKYTVLDEQRREAKEGKSQLNKKMQHSCGVTHSIALSYPFQNTTILVNLFQLGLH